MKMGGKPLGPPISSGNCFTGRYSPTYRSPPYLNLFTFFFGYKLICMSDDIQSYSKKITLMLEMNWFELVTGFQTNIWDAAWQTPRWVNSSSPSSYSEEKSPKKTTDHLIFSSKCCHILFQYIDTLPLNVCWIEHLDCHWYQWYGTKDHYIRVIGPRPFI